MPLIPLHICSLPNPRRFNTWWRDWPLQPTSMESHQLFQPLPRHSPASPSYIVLFLLRTSFMHYSQGTFSFNRSTCLVVSDTRTISGLSVVTMILSGNFHSRFSAAIHMRLPVVTCWSWAIWWHLLHFNKGDALPDGCCFWLSAIALNT